MPTPTSPTGDARDSILDAAASVLLRDGIHAAKVEDIARAAGVSLGLLNYHFGGRLALLRAALVRALDTLDGLPAEEDAAALVGAPMTAGAWARLRADALREAVFDAEVRRALDAATTRWETVVAERSGADARTVRVLSSLADGLRQRVATDLMSEEEARILLAAAADHLDLSSRTRAGRP
ncbi:helix-turn-helix domain containing protein [Streptomyces sp. MS2A]|nr:helix-turn-helix domain containing protein [Streptomyces sp. MS2A]